jgi:hypothetical protein
MTAISTYSWTLGTGFGVIYADTATLPTQYGLGIALNGNTDSACVQYNDPYVNAYPFTPRTGLGVKYGNPATKPTGNGFGVAFLRGGFWLS